MIQELPFPGDPVRQGPLAGLLVADFTENLPGPVATMLLAQLGATVVKVERRGGESGRWHPLFPITSAGKRSVELDLKSAWDRQSAAALASRSDVVIEGFRPGVADRLGIGFHLISTMNPATIYCSLSGYGQQGSKRDRPGHDLNYLSETGFVFGHRDDDGRQLLGAPNGMMADYLAGLLAAVSILGRLTARDHQSGPVHLDLALSDAAVLPALASIAAALDGRTHITGARSLPHYRLYATKDGRHIALGITPHEQEFWSQLSIAVGRPEWASLDARQRRAQAVELAADLTAIFGDRTLADWELFLEPLNIPWSAVRTPQEAVIALAGDDRQLLHPETRGLDLLLTGQTPGRSPALGEANVALAQLLARPGRGPG